MKKDVVFLLLSIFLIAPKVCFAQMVDEKWVGHIFAGYNNTNGNTKKGSGSVEAETDKELENGNLQLKGNIFYSESGGNMDG